ncbi:MAG: hypothetical protein M3P98_04520 [bacterium]|nr:hypothetical protein [bacterium]
MARYFYCDKKTEADGLCILDMKWLRKKKYIEENCIWNGSLHWTHRPSGTRSNINAYIDNTSKIPTIKLSYTQTSYSTGEKSHYEYAIRLLKTPCKFGGSRHWFTCPLQHNGIACNRKASKLYLSGKYFGCRHCHQLSYNSKNENRKNKYFKAFNTDIQIDKIEEKYHQLKRKTYAGKPTNKASRLIAKKERVVFGFSNNSVHELRSKLMDSIYNTS